MAATPWTSDSWLVRRGVKRVAHFHVDHFEPGRRDKSGELMGLAHVNRWIADTSPLPWASRASVFYKTSWLSKLTEESAADRRKKGLVVLETGGQPFGCRDHDDALVQAVIDAGHDFHVHVHHEHWTSGQVTNTPPDPETDAVRLDAVLGWLLGRYRGMGIDMADWGHIHGAWALNGSDPSICRIPNEIQILMKHGCVADFTFPSGRPWCDPALKVPHTVIPYSKIRCYDTNAAQIMRLEPGASVMTGNRFLIWNQETGPDYSSLDNINKVGSQYDAEGLDLFANRLVGIWGQYGWVQGTTLYLKTHAHSLNDDVWDSQERHRSPLTAAPVVAAFRILEGHAKRNGVEVQYLTARDVLAELRITDAEPRP